MSRTTEMLIASLALALFATTSIAQNAAVAAPPVQQASVATTVAPSSPTAGTIPLPASAVVPAPAAGAPAQPIPVTPAEEGLSNTAQQLSDMDAKLAVALKSLDLQSTQAKSNEIAKKLGDVKSGLSSVPELVGVSGVGKRLTAEFLATNAIVRAGAGDWITSDWKVEAITSSQVTLSRRGSKALEKINFGHKPVSASDVANDAAALNRSSSAPVVETVQSAPVSLPLPAQR